MHHKKAQRHHRPHFRLAQSRSAAFSRLGSGGGLGGHGPRVRPSQLDLRPGPVLRSHRLFIAHLAALQLDGVNGYRANTLRLPNWSSPARCNKGPPCSKLYLPLSITGLKSAQAGSPSTGRTASSRWTEATVSNQQTQKVRAGKPTRTFCAKPLLLHF